MKKFLLFLVYFGVIAIAHSQSVAINTDGSPPHSSAILDIKSATKGVLLPRTSTNTRNAIPGVKGLMVYDTTLNKLFYNIGSGWIEVSSGGNTNYWSQFGASGHIYNNNPGNVGIGTISTIYKLAVDGEVMFTGDPPTLRMMGGTTSAFPKILWSYTNNHIDYIMTHILDKFVISRAGGFLGFSFDLVVDTTGNIGISSASPQTKLHIENGSDVGNGSGGFLQLGSSSGTNIGFDNNEIQGRNNGVVSRLVLQNGGGGVQIGPTLVPTGYALSVDGKTICEELKVKLSGSGWPDYVFADNYRKPTLEQVESFIKQHRHLPGIPSAKEIDKEGLMVGDMQKRMMEKIEELTLYIIELKKEIDDLKKANQ